LFLASRFSLILAGGHKALSRAELDALSRGQTFRLSFSRAVVKVSFAGG
jgi:tRNA G10  N-methylase Trm11